MSEPFRKGDKIRLNDEMLRNFPRARGETWEIVNPGNETSTVQRPRRRKEGFRKERWANVNLVLVKHSNQVFSNDQEIAIREIVERRVHEHEESNFHE